MLEISFVERWRQLFFKEEIEVKTCEPGMLHDLLCAMLRSNPVSGVLLQELRDEILELIRVWYADLVGKRELSTKDRLVLRLASPIAEWSHTEHHLIRYDTDTPPVS